jgi:hypothetical protein
MGILVCKTENSILNEVYINTEKKEVYTKDGRVYPFVKVIASGGKPEKSVAKENPGMDFCYSNFKPGMNYGFYDDCSLKFSLYDPVDFEYIKEGHIFEYAGINLYRGIYDIINEDIPEDEKYLKCKQLIKNIGLLSEIYEEAAYIKYKADLKRQDEEHEERVKVLKDEIKEKEAKIEGLDNRGIIQKVFNTKGVER